jgi:hypothetical protein
MALGQPVSVIDNELFPDVVDLLEYLRTHPPVHVMLAQFFEAKTTSRKPSTRAEFEGWAKELERK